MFFWSKSVERSLSAPPQDSNLHYCMPCTSEAVNAQYLNVRQHRLGTIIIQTVHYPVSISPSMIVRSQAHCPRGKFCMVIPTYFQITLPGSSTVRYTSVPVEAARFSNNLQHNSTTTNIINMSGTNFYCETV